MGLLDADVYGPSIPRMMNLSGQPQLSKRTCTMHINTVIHFSDNFVIITEDRMIPLTNYGVKW